MFSQIYLILNRPTTKIEALPDPQVFSRPETLKLHTDYNQFNSMMNRKYMRNLVCSLLLQYIV